MACFLILIEMQLIIKIMRNFILTLLLIFTLTLISHSAHAQLKADFTVDKSSGCSGLKVSFTNTTVGASASAIYNWSFGNTNSISTTDPNAPIAAIYNNPQTYTATLTVTDGSVTDIKTQTIVVYSNPTANFIVSDSVGCTPLKVIFTSTSIAGSGLLNSFFWDFGDGTTDNGDSTKKTVSHFYSVSGKYTVKLIVQSTTGCDVSSLGKTDFINAQLTPKANYTRSKSYLCKTGDSITFTSTSKDTDLAKYVWKFGDKSSSTIDNPTHTYNSVGSFHDSLIVQNANGCTDTASLPTPLFVGQFQTNFTYSGLCTKANVLFTNTSSPTPDSSVWKFSNNPNTISGLTATNLFDAVGSYQVMLTNYYGSCNSSSNKTITVLPTLQLAGFESTITPGCGGKTLLIAKDTSIGSTWTWIISGGVKDTLTKNPASFSLQSDKTYTINLYSKQTNGCTATVSKTITLPSTLIKIETKSNDSLSNTSGCAGLKVDFSSNPSVGIKSFNWDLGDGNTSTDTFPSHTYNTIGKFPVKLSYETTDGCNDTVWLRYIQTFSKPVPRFTTKDTIHCGGRVFFNDLTPSPVDYWTWSFSDSGRISHEKNPYHNFKDTGYFDVKLIAYNGTCFDSVTYHKYVYILPPFANDTAFYSCDGVRNTLKFKFGYRFVETAFMDFGDSSAILPLNSTIRSVPHVYPKTGVYLTKLTSTYGQCKVTDTLFVSILTKQNPQISTSDSVVCVNDSVKVTIANNSLQANPSRYGIQDNYNIYRWQTDDTSTFKGMFLPQPDWFISDYFGYLSGMKLGKDSFRVILQSSNYGCLDTSNFIHVTVKGPVANYSIQDTKNCFKLPITFNDLSKPTFGIPIVKWIWGFGDAVFDTSSTNASVNHIYNNPGPYPTSLKVIDSAGCYAEKTGVDSAFPKGPKADFNWNPKFVVVNTSANFINNTNTYEATNVNYSWSFTSNGGYSTSKISDINIFYPSAITDTVTLIATDANDKTCTDKVVKVVPIKKVFAMFNYTTEYLNGKNNNCPPLRATFTSQSVNADSIQWSFGDGTSGSGITANKVATHYYNLAGSYIITLYAYKSSQLLDSISDTLIIKGAFAKLSSNVLKGCVPTKVDFTITESNSLSYTWDFGDGAVDTLSKDTFKSHLYKIPNLYTPHVTLVDINGCTSYFPFPYRILIDTLNTSFAPNITPICDSGIVSFVPKTKCLSVDSLQATLAYHWDLGTGEAKDTSNSATPSFFYRIGKYPVTQTVTSFAGCVASFTDTISVVRSARGAISGPNTICGSLPATFSGTVENKTDSVVWLWKFGNGAVSTLQNPNAVYFTTGKDSILYDTVLLITQLNNCYDTTKAPLIVYPKPFIELKIDTNKICIGLKDRLVAHDGNKFDWTPKEKLINDSTMSVQPTDTTTYFVTVTNEYNCSSKDSSTIKVVKHLPVIPLYDTFVCKGKSIQLPVFGADSYRWLSDINTIKAGDLTSSSPTVTPIVSPTIYAVERKNECFVDTPKIKVNVENYPTVSTRDTFTLLTGSVVQLQSIVSPDVVSYQWSPSDYLSCTDCATPVCTPRSDITYTVVTANKYGCTATTNLKISLLCSNTLFMPSAFTPSANINNVFYPLGRGVKVVTHFVVFDRLGNKIFEKNNFNINDKGAGWNGTIYGIQAPNGTYVYSIEAVCDTGETLPLRKGTVVLIR